MHEALPTLFVAVATSYLAASAYESMVTVTHQRLICAWQRLINANQWPLYTKQRLICSVSGYFVRSSAASYTAVVASSVLEAAAYEVVIALPC